MYYYQDYIHSEVSPKNNVEGCYLTFLKVSINLPKILLVSKRLMASLLVNDHSPGGPKEPGSKNPPG